MDQNPYQSPSMPAEPALPPPSDRLRIDWYGLGRAVLVLIVSHAVIGAVFLGLDWLRIL